MQFCKQFSALTKTQMLGGDRSEVRRVHRHRLPHAADHSQQGDTQLQGGRRLRGM